MPRNSVASPIVYWNVRYSASASGSVSISGRNGSSALASDAKTKQVADQRHSRTA